MTYPYRIPRRAWRWLASYLAASPGTYILFFVVVVTTLVLRGVDAGTVSRVLREQSTNLFQMTADAPRVLFLSTFLLDQGSLWKVLITFTVVLVPVERWIGTYRWLLVFAAGHVGATLATTLGIWLQVRSGVGGGQLSYVVDVGVSYGVAAVAGVVVYRLPRPLSAVAAVGLVGVHVLAVVRTGTFTDWGHLGALVIGFGLGPLVRPTLTTRTAEAAGRFRRTFDWVRTPPPAGPPVRRRLLARVGGLLLIGAASTLLVVIVTGDTDIELAPGPAFQLATVIGQPVSCGHGCSSVAVRLASGATAVMRLPPGALTRTGARVAVHSVPGHPEEVRLSTVARRAQTVGLLGETATAVGGAGLALLLTSGRLAARHSGDTKGLVDRQATDLSEEDAPSPGIDPWRPPFRMNRARDSALYSPAPPSTSEER